MSDLTEFLLARIAEDENQARDHDAVPAPWGFWHADRVLAECEVKRRIVQLHGSDSHECPEWGGAPVDDAADGRDFFTGHGIDCFVVRCLALPYADHPDFREQWRP